MGHFDVGHDTFLLWIEFLQIIILGGELCQISKDSRSGFLCKEVIEQNQKVFSAVDLEKTA